jgi:PIN domain nuclease of toxin-antitoxin system
LKLLLDTHVWLWMQVSPDRMQPEARARIADGNNEILLSAASGWEIAIKYSLGRLPLPEDPVSYVPSRMSRSGTRGLPVQHAHALAVAGLPRLHRDPFDRVLVAQALIEKATLVTADAQLAQYDVPLLKT